jgi:hypothetical protein
MNKSNIFKWILWVALLIFYTTLFLKNRFGVNAYVFMLCFNSFFLLALLSFPRLKEFDIRNLKLVLAEIKREKEEVFATEKQLKEMAIYVAEVLGFLSLLGMRTGDRESYNLRRDWVKAKLRDLKNKIGIDLKNVAVYEKLYSEVDELVEEASLTTNPKYKENKARLEELSKQLKEQMKKDIDCAKS